MKFTSVYLLIIVLLASINADGQDIARYDVDGNENLSILDANILASEIACENKTSVLDVNRDNKVSVVDLTLLINRLLGNINYQVTDIILPTHMGVILDSTATISATLCPTEPDISTLEWQSSNNEIATVDPNGMVTGLKEGFATITASTTDGSNISSSCIIDVTAHEFTDLALPSGTLWANTNLGAEKPEEAGTFYAWGETDEKDGFTDANYIDYTYIKYTLNGDTELLVADDAANVNWGERWRMPGKEQLDELVENCTWTWCDGESVQYNGKNAKGYIITGNNGNTIFLPAEGLMNFGTSNFGNNVSGYYWSRTLYPEKTSDGYSQAYNIYFNVYRGYSVSHSERFLGEQIRPVRVSD